MPEEPGRPAHTPDVTVEPAPVGVEPATSPAPTTTIIARPDGDLGTTVISAPEPPPPPSAPAAESVAPPAATLPDVTYVPLAVTVGDGFKLGCGFFMAFVVFLLVGVVILAALFALGSATGVSLPLGR